MAIAQPLAGKRIVLTRAPEDSAELTRALESLGARVISLPTVAFAPPEDWQKLDEHLHHPDERFDAILFLSKNAARYFFDRCAQLGIKCEMLRLSQLFIAAVGPTTADALKDKGVRVDYVAKTHTGESLVRELRETLAGRRVLLPRSDRGDDRVLNALREIGATVTEVIAYRTAVPAALDPAILARVRGGEVDAVVFASPSAFHSLRDFIGAADTAQLSTSVQFVAIGPTTSRAIRESGARVAIESAKASAAGLAASLAKHYQENSPAGRPA
jgi:uroporphyrinogen-III synthase